MPTDQDEKKEFFARLDDLDSLDESTESEDAFPQLQARKRPRVEAVAKSDGVTPENHEAKKNDVAELAKTGVPSMRKALTEHQPVIEQTSHLSRNSRPMRRTNSEPERPGRSRKCNSTKVISSLFNGLTFFFIPNDDVVKVRKLRIASAVAQGATWARKLDSNVTHIIVDATIDAAGASRVIKDKVDLSQVALVKDTWLIESMSHKNVRDPSQGRFQLKGAVMVSGKAKPSVAEITLKQPKTTQAIAVELKGIEESDDARSGPRASDELSQIMEEMKGVGRLPFDEALDLDNFVSSGDERTEDGASSASVPPQREHREERTEDKIVESSNSKSGALVAPLRENRGFACMEAHTGKSDNPNDRTIEILQQMATYYDRTGNNWRTSAYRKAISALRKQETLISTRKQALAVFGIGPRLADKIEEIVATDQLQRLESIQADPSDSTLQLFMGIYDVGYMQAKRWMDQGYRTLDDLKVHAKLSTNQQVGVDHYDDFQQRIPRAEVERHGAMVQKALTRTDKKLQAIIGGSYRRGMPDSGDIDVMITHPTADLSQLREWIFDNVVPYLFEIGVLKYALATSRGRSKEQLTPAKGTKKPTKSKVTNTALNVPSSDLAFARSTSSGTKLLGASQLPPTTDNPSPPWRRIDLLLVPACSLGANLIYFTGNDIFNRSMRLLASRKGMRLNQHGLYKNVMRGPGRVKETEGELVEGRSEKKIFQILGVPWRPPEERRC